MDFGDIIGFSYALMVIWILWYLFYVVQLVMAYGTAYRAAKSGGDNGVSLFGWMFVYGMASMVPGLGIYFWVKSRKTPERALPGPAEPWNEARR